MCYDNTKPSNTERRALYQDALLKYDQWVRFGSKETPKCYFKKNCEYDGNKGEVANTFINLSLWQGSWIFHWKFLYGACFN